VPMCPIGYFTEGRDCLIQNKNGPAAKFTFNKLSNEFYDTIEGLKAEIIEANRAYPAYMRGVYFTGNFSALILPSMPNDKLIFGIRFFICFWLYAGESGVLLSKYNVGEDLVKVFLDDFEINAIINLSHDQIASKAEKKLKKETWNHIIVALEKNGNSEVSIYINGQLQSFKENSDYLSDTVNGGIILGSFSNQSFSGFIYSFELWLKLPEFSQLFKQPCGKCNICPVSGGCLLACNISMYYLYNSCENCLEECKTGCRYGLNCSLCKDEKCNICETYNKKSCLVCEPGYILKNNLCIACEERFYFEEKTKTCEPCKRLCKNCISSDECENCVKWSELVNRTCKCQKGYYEDDDGCIRKLFNCVLKINGDNELKLLFTEELRKKLEKTDLSVKIEEKEVEFNLNELSTFEYQIIIQGEVFKKKKKLVVYFVSDIVSKKYSLLGKEKVEANLFAYKTNDLKSPLFLIEGHTTTVFLSSVGIIAGLSIVNVNPKTLYTFLNSAELFSYTILYNLELDSELLEFLKSLIITSNIPSIFDLLEIDTYNIPEPKLTYLGFDTIFIYKTSGFFVSSFILILFFNLLIVFTRFNGVCSKILEYFKYKIYLRYWIQTFFELFLGSLIALKYFAYNGIQQVANIILCLFILVIFIKVLQVLAFIAHLYSVHKRSKLKTQEEIKLFQSKYGEIFDEFNQDRTNGCLFYCFFIIRRFLIALLIIFFDEFVLQLSISISLSLVVSSS